MSPSGGRGGAGCDADGGCDGGGGDDAGEGVGSGDGDDGGDGDGGGVKGVNRGDGGVGSGEYALRPPRLLQPFS